jgi:transposase
MQRGESMGRSGTDPRARQESDGRLACRLLGVANALAGMSRERATRQAGMDRQTLKDWVIQFNAEGVEGLRDRAKSGRPPWLDDGQLAAFKALVLRDPDPERDGVSTWRAKDLCRIVEHRFGVSYTVVCETLCRRHNSVSFAPASYSRRIPMIRSSVNRLLRICTSS